MLEMLWNYRLQAKLTGAESIGIVLFPPFRNCRGGSRHWLAPAFDPTPPMSSGCTLSLGVQYSSIRLDDLLEWVAMLIAVS